MKLSPMSDRVETLECQARAHHFWATLDPDRAQQYHFAAQIGVFVPAPYPGKLERTCLQGAVHPDGPVWSAWAEAVEAAMPEPVFRQWARGTLLFGAWGTLRQWGDLFAAPDAVERLCRLSAEILGHSVSAGEAEEALAAYVTHTAEIYSEKAASGRGETREQFEAHRHVECYAEACRCAA